MRPDAKSQVTLEYDDNNKPVRIDAIVVSTQHDDFDTEEKMLAKRYQMNKKNSYTAGEGEIYKVCAFL